MKKSNVFAILGLVFSCLLSAVLGIIFSIIGLNEAKKNHGYLKGVAIGGLVVGIIRIIGYILVIFAVYLFVISTNDDNICKQSYDCRTGLFGNYECKYISDSTRDVESNSVCSKKQVEKFNLSTIEVDVNKEKVNIVVFYGSGCPHCEHLFEYLSSLGRDSDYNYMFTVTKYDTWSSSKNLELMYKAQDHFNLAHSPGVPFFIIGNKYYSGFGNPNTMSNKEDLEFKNAIKNAYNNGYTNPSDYLDN